LTCQRGNNIRQRLREKNVGGAVADLVIGIRGKDAEGFNAIIRLKRGRFVANRKLTFESRVAQTDFIAQGFVNCRLPALLSGNRA
jgi:hypothetical protein